MNEQKCSNAAAEEETSVYVKPVLMVYGDVRDITLGPTPGTLESGNEGSLCERGIGTCF